MVGYRQTNQKTDTGKTLTRWPVFVDHFTLSAREFTSAQATQNEITTRITIRQRNDITPKCRILYRGKIFNIEGVLPDPDSGLEYLTLPCSEGVNDG